MAGGELNGDNGAAFGPSALEFLQRFKVRLSVISISAIDSTIGPMDYTLREAEIARCVLSRGEKKIIATDHSKFGQSALVKVCDFADIDLLITDKRAPEDVEAAVLGAGIGIEIAPTHGKPASPGRNFSASA
jgi:DeoR family glycerol-3-phosphate regulon repressor